MKTATTIVDRREPSIAADISIGLLTSIWRALCVPVGVLLRILEPFVNLILGGLAVLSIFTAVFFEFAHKTPNFPFWTVLLIGIASGCLAYLFRGLVSLLSR